VAHRATPSKELAVGTIVTYFCLRNSDKVSPATNKKRSRKIEGRSQGLTPCTGLRKEGAVQVATRMEADK
jgi:hypothetical protein